MVKELPIFIALQQQHKSRKRSSKELNMVNAKNKRNECRFIHLYQCNLNASNAIKEQQKKNETKSCLP